MRPCVVSASKLGASSPSSRPGMAVGGGGGEWLWLRLRSRSARYRGCRRLCARAGSPPPRPAGPGGLSRDPRTLRHPRGFAAVCGVGERLRAPGPLLLSPVMATYVSELEAAKKSLSEALGENVKQ